jgi:hypothetical protein
MITIFLTQIESLTFTGHDNIRQFCTHIDSDQSSTSTVQSHLRKILEHTIELIMSWQEQHSATAELLCKPLDLVQSICREAPRSMLIRLRSEERDGTSAVKFVKRPFASAQPDCRSVGGC